MSPDERIRRLRSEVESELDRIGRVAGELRTAAAELRRQGSPAHGMAVAGYLHAFYTGCEAVLARIDRLFEPPSAGSGWHVSLLIRSAAPIAARRPPVLAAHTATDLGELLRFRHFFRSSYGVDLNPVRLAALSDIAERAEADFRADIGSFLVALERAG